MKDHTRLHSKMEFRPTFVPIQTVLLQRKCICGGSPGIDGECAECRSKRLALQRQSTGQRGSSAVPPIVHDVLRSPGQPLDAATRAFMEPRFGHDFSKVRVHTDGSAAESARAVNALAYTVGSDVVFREGLYAPETDAGKQLLAHELTHTIQQAKVPQSVPLQLLPSESNDEQERQADSAAKTLLRPSHSELQHSIQSILQNSTIMRPRLALKADPTVIHKLSATAIRKHPDYIDNNIARMEFGGAQQAILHYADGAKLTIGLVPRWIKPPLESVDYRSTHSEYTEVRDSKELKFLYKPGQIPEKTLPWEIVLKKYAKTVKFAVDPSSGKIVPNHLNPITAPKLCKFLRYAEAEYVKHSNEFAKGMIKILEMEKIILELALTLEMMGGLKASARSRVPAKPIATGELVGPLGKLTLTEIERAIAASGGRTVELFTKLTQAPIPGRAISCATSRVLAEAARSTGQIFVVRIPEILFRKMVLIGVIARITTMMGGATGIEYRILPQAAEIVIRFLVP